MTFKDQLTADLGAVFNTDEFATQAKYNGKDAQVVLDSSMLQSTGIPGVMMPGATIFVRQDQVASCKPGDKVIIGKEVYRVTDRPVLDGGVWQLQVDSEIATVTRI